MKSFHHRPLPDLLDFPASTAARKVAAAKARVSFILKRGETYRLLFIIDFLLGSYMI